MHHRDEPDEVTGGGADCRPRLFDWFRAGAPENDSTRSIHLISTELRKTRAWPPR